ncbi:hypothetical protein DL96DRAFT_1716686 [Flagelloscypha sp. PMI_526]|nr:hypothetical protein DL96DRAFT_1716686 [Flagelloscypha sp. PMI_526]
MDLFSVRLILGCAWVFDFGSKSLPFPEKTFGSESIAAAEAFYFGAYVNMYTIIFTSEVEPSRQLSQTALYVSRWTSFALNLLVTLLIAYRAWKFKNVLIEAGWNTRESKVYHILARLVETGGLLLSVQLLIAILATTHIHGDPTDPGYIVTIVLAESSLIVIVSLAVFLRPSNVEPSFSQNAHPAAMSLVSISIASKGD